MAYKELLIEELEEIKVFKDEEGGETTTSTVL